MTTRNLFQNIQTLTVSPYRVKSPVSLNFLGVSLRIGRKCDQWTHTHFTELPRLWEQFRFSEIAAKLSEICPSMGFKEAEDADTRGPIAPLEEKANQPDHVIAILEDKVTAICCNGNSNTFRISFCPDNRNCTEAE
jgi:hypothetical protein